MTISALGLNHSLAELVSVLRSSLADFSLFFFLYKCTLISKYVCTEKEDFYVTIEIYR